MTPPRRDDERRARFQALYEANYESILGYALRRARGADALDVVSETFLVAWRRIDVMPTGETTLPWLYGVARRVVSERQRSGRRRDRLLARLD